MAPLHFPVTHCYYMKIGWIEHFENDTFLVEDHFSQSQFVVILLFCAERYENLFLIKG